MVFAGGVARNQAVRQAPGSPAGLSPGGRRAGAPVRGHRRLPPEAGGRPSRSGRRLPVLEEVTTGRRFFHAPLSLRLSSYPDFDGGQGGLYAPRVVRDAPAVEVERFALPAAAEGSGGILGVDIGSTSTKAVLLGADRRLLAGLYTRTSGRPLAAVRAILEALAAEARGDQPFRRWAPPGRGGGSSGR